MKTRAKNSPRVEQGSHLLIRRDLLERLIETCQDWVGENEWRRNTTPKNIRMMAETEQAISEAKGLK